MASDKILIILNIFVPALFGSAAVVTLIKAWASRPENLARAKKINIEADGPVIAAYQNIIEGYKDQLKETEVRWEKRFSQQAVDFEAKISEQSQELHQQIVEFKNQVINCQKDLDACKRK